MASTAQQDRDVLVTPFLQLQGPVSQRKALHGLVEKLTQHQIRELRSLVDSSNNPYHCDIIAELPYEITQMIFDYLQLQQCFQAQRVSRTWRKILSSPKTVDYLLRTWYPGGESGLCIPENLSAKTVAALKAEHVDAFRTGRPFSIVTYEGEPSDLATSPIAYAGGVLAWIDYAYGRSIETLDLKTGLRNSLTSEDRTQFHTVAMTCSVIAALDWSGRCHVWETINARRQFLLRLPSAKYKRMVASGSALAVAWGTDSQIEIATWSLKTGKTQTFLLDLHPIKHANHRLFKIMLDHKGESLILFERIAGMHGETVYGKRSTTTKDAYDIFYFTRTSLDGIIQAQGLYEWYPSPKDKCTQCWVDVSAKIETLENNGSTTVWLFARSDLNESRVESSSEIARVCFNTERNLFEMDRRNLKPGGQYYSAEASFFVWKDIVYWFNSDLSGKTTIIDFQAPTSESTESLVERAESSDPELLERSARIFGDETFLIQVRSTNWTLWCFERNMQMANGYVRGREDGSCFLFS